VRLFEKFSISKIARPSGNLIWFHCASVGEFNSIKAIITLFYQKNNVLITSGTVTSAQEVKKFQKIYPKVIHQFCPFDMFFISRKFIKFWHPNQAIFIESEIWPNLIFHAKKLGIKITLLNARISDKSFVKWKFIQRFGLNIFNFIDLCLAQSIRDLIKFKKLGCRQTHYEGNLKSYVGFNVKIQKPINKENIWLAASTHQGEEEELIKIHQDLLNRYPNLILIIAPRHPERFSEISNLLERKNINFNKYSKDALNFGNKNFYLLDTLGKMNEAFNFAKFSFIGGSLLANIGGHNPFEALRSYCFPISGQYFANFRQSYRELRKKNICSISNDCQQLYEIIINIIDNQKFWEDFINNNRIFLEEKSDLLQKIYNKLHEKSGNIT